MRKYIFCALAVLSIITAVGYIRLSCIKKQCRYDSQICIGSSAMKTEVLSIHAFLKVNNYIDQFGYLNSQYRFNQKKQLELLYILRDKDLFYTSEASGTEYDKFSQLEYFNCLQTLIILCNLMDSCLSLEPQEVCNSDKILFLQHKLAVWVLNLPHGSFTGRENILKRLCAENLRKTMPVHKCE